MAGQIPDVRLRIIVEDGGVKSSFSSATNAVSQFANTVKSRVEGASDSLDTMKGHVEALHDSLETLKGVGEAFLSFEAIKKVTEGLTEAQIEIQRVHFSLQAALGSAEAANTEFKFLYDTSQRVGASFEELAGSYGQMSASGKAAGVTLKQTRNLFSALTEASTVFHLSAQQVHSAMIGIEQSFAMGSFRSQELRMQIGQQLPGVFENFANRVKAEGKDFNKLLSEGGLEVREFVDTLAAAIRDSYDPAALEDASQAINATINRTKNELILFKSELGGGLFQDTSLLGLKAFNAALETLSQEPVLKGTQIAILAGSMLAFGKSVKFATDRVVKTVAAGNEWFKVNNKVGASSKALKLATSEYTAAVASARSAGTGLVAAEARLAAARAAEAQETNRETRAELANAEAKAVNARASKAAALSELERAAAARSAALATAEATGATSAARVALGGLATAGRGLLAVFGGIPGLIAAVVAGLVLFVDWSTEASRAADKLDDSSKDLSSSITAAGDALDRYYKLKQKYDKATPEDQKKLAYNLSIARQQAMEGLGATERPGAINAGEILVIQEKLTKAQKELADARKKAGPTSTQVNFTTGAPSAPDPAVVRAQQAVLQLQRALKDAKDVQSALNTLQNAAKPAKKDDASKSAEEASQRSLNAIHHEAEVETSTREAALGKQKSNVEQVEAQILEVKKKFAKENDKLSKKQIDDANAEIDATYKPLLEAARKQDALKKSSANASGKAAAADGQLERAIDSVRRVQEGLDNQIEGQSNPILARTLALQAQLDAARKSAIATVNASKASDAAKATAQAKINAEYENGVKAIEKYRQTLLQQQTDSATNALDATLSKFNAEAKSAADKMFAQLDKEYMEFQLQLEAAHIGPSDARYKEAMAAWDKHQKYVIDTFDKANDKMGQFAVQAARNIQSQIGSALENAFEGNYDSIRASFARLLRQMVAQVIATKLSRYLFGDFDKTGKVSGVAGGAINWLAGVFGAEKKPGAAPASGGAAAANASVVSSATNLATALQAATAAASRFAAGAVTPGVAGPAGAAAAGAANAAAVPAKAAKATEAQTEAVKVNTAANAAAAVQTATAGTSLQGFGQVVGLAGTLLTLFQTATEAATAAQTAAAAASTVRALAAGGGEIHGPGTGTSDSIPAQLSDGEFVVNAKATSRWLPILHKINSGARAPRTGRLHLAAGGMVKRMGSVGDRGAGSPQGDGQAPIRLINAVDPAYVHDQMGSAGGEKVVLNIIGRNSRSIAQQLGR
jgi:tape measure domain-containing protein